MINLPFWNVFGLNVVSNFYSTVTDLTSSTTTPFLTFNLSIKTHLLTNQTTLTKSHKRLHRIIRKLKFQGLGYRKISNELNRHHIKSPQGKTFYPSLVQSIWKKIVKRERVMSKPVFSEYRDFDIEVGVRY